MPTHFDKPHRKLFKTTFREIKKGSSFINSHIPTGLGPIDRRPRRIVPRRFFRRMLWPATRPALILIAGVFIGISLDRIVPGHGIDEITDSVIERGYDFYSRLRGYLPKAITIDEAHGQGGDLISGHARVIDGDTLQVRNTRIRMSGIDAPESRQMCSDSSGPWPCGAHSTAALKKAVGRKAVSCKAIDRDRYGREIAICYSGDFDLNQWMVDNGWAFAYRQYSSRYVQNESSAKAARRGIWRGSVVPPWDWRKGKRLPGITSQSARSSGTRTQSQAAPGGCRIKGNISSSGRIYHVPGGRYYASTRIDKSQGERWFCSESAARAAGFRRSRY